MNKQVLLVQFRDDESREHEIKSFLATTNLGDQLKITNAVTDTIDWSPESLLKNTSCVIIGPSGQYDLTLKPKPITNAIEKTKELFTYIVEKDFPTFAVCFGHQFLAQFLGGTVGRPEDQAEAGTYEITLTEAAQADKIFKEVPKRFQAISGHKESVTSLPSNAVLLASSEKCPIHAFKYKQNIYSTQFHPELSVDGLIERLTMYPEYMKGKTLEDIRGQFADNVEASSKILTNFISEYHRI